MAEKFEDDMLDDLFAAARADTRAAPSADLLARVLTEAEGLQVQPVESATPSEPRMGFWAAALASLGGWPSLGGVAMAGIAGVWIGVSAGTTFAQDTLGLDLYGETAQSYLSDLDDVYAFDYETEE